jgi:hypothetical protein
LKNVLTSAPILGVINPKMGELILCTNASDLAISAMLMQEGQIITYEFKKLTFGKLNYTHENELLVVIHALKI